jgi:hypothetical protein
MMFVQRENGILDGCFLAFVYGGGEVVGRGDDCFLIQMERGRDG